MNPKNHPNATVALVSATAAAAASYGAERWLGYELNDELKVMVGGAFVALVLAVGKDGIRGTVGKLWRGSQPEQPMT